MQEQSRSRKEVLETITEAFKRRSEPFDLTRVIEPALTAEQRVITASQRLLPAQTQRFSNH